MSKQTYVVAKGVSFVGKKKHYKEGDAIDESAFGKKEAFDKLVSAGKIVPAPEKATESEQPKSEQPKEDKPEQPKK